MTQPLPITRYLRNWQAGDAAAGDLLLERVYPDLQSIAMRYLAREGKPVTLQPGDLVNEVFTRLLGEDIEWRDRAHFFALVARTMRRILVDHARRRNREKRGRDLTRVTLNEELHGDSRTLSLLDLDSALEELSRIDPRQTRIFELRIFGGLTIQETAEVMAISARTVNTEWRMVRAWLFGRMQGRPLHG